MECVSVGAITKNNWKQRAYDTTFLRDTMNIITHDQHQPTSDETTALTIANDADIASLDLTGITRIDLQFPKFTDGRAYSQAYLLRRRQQYTGQLRATGDVLIDQLVHMARSGFDVAVLKEGLDAGDAQRQFDRFNSFYQGDAVTPAPHFVRQPA